MAYALLIIPILTFLIFIHELGHYITAKRAGMKVEEFGFGLPPRIWGTQRGETLWSINLIPVGGFVKVLGEDGQNRSDRSMQSKTTGQRALFITAGSIMNFLAAFVLIGVVLTAQGDPHPRTYITDVAQDSPAAEAGWQPGYKFVAINGEPVDSAQEIVDITTDTVGTPTSFVFEDEGRRITSTLVPRVNPPADQGATGIQLAQTLEADLTIDQISDESNAAAAGLQAGDKIIQINDTQVTDTLSYQLALQQNAGETVEITVMRDGEPVTVSAQVPADYGLDSNTMFGAVIHPHIQFDQPAFYMIPIQTVDRFFDYLQRMGEGLLLLIQGEVPFDSVAGPIGMGQLTSEILEESALPLWVSVANITIVLSLNLAILNLLPIPALDGGRLLFVVIEILRRGKRVAPEKEGLVHFVGLVLLLTFMIAVAFMDIDRIVSGQSLLQ